MPSDPHLVQLSRRLFLTAFAGAARIENWVVDRIAPKLDETFAPKGTVLYREGDSPRFVYFMEQGEVLLSREGAPPIHMIGKWVVGALECGVDLPRTRTATTAVDTRFVTAPGELWHELLEDSFEMVRTAFLGTSRGVEGLLSSLTEEQLEYPGKALPFDLPRGPLDLVERLLVLSNTGLLATAGMQTLTDLAHTAEEKRLGHVNELQTEGRDERMHVLLEGTIVARRTGRSATVRVRPGSFIPHALARSKDWDLESVGTGSSGLRTLAFRPEDLLDEMEEHTDLVRALLGALWNEREWLLSNKLAPDGKIVLR